MKDGGGLVLVCDDTEQIRTLMSINLTLEGYDVEEVADGQELLERLQKPGARRPRVITLDAHMEPRDGWWAIRHIRQDPALADIPVIMVTASVQQHDRIQAGEEGFDAFVAKPFDPDYLLELVHGFVARGRSYAPEP